MKVIRLAVPAPDLGRAKVALEKNGYKYIVGASTNHVGWSLLEIEVYDHKEKSAIITKLHLKNVRVINESAELIDNDYSKLDRFLMTHEELLESIDPKFTYSNAGKPGSDSGVKVDEVGHFLVVTAATKESTVNDIMFRANVSYMTLQQKGGLKPTDIRGIFLIEHKEKAEKMAEELIAATKSGKENERISTED